jgi:Recombinase zinc beta ribbon domain
VLTGLLRCGRCGRKVHIRYRDKHGTAARYLCSGDFDTGGKYCLGFGGATVERRLSELILGVISPHGVEASLVADGVATGPYGGARAAFLSRPTRPDNLIVANHVLHKLQQIGTSGGLSLLEEGRDMLLHQAWSARGGRARGDPGRHPAPAGAAGQWLAREAPEVVTSDGLKPGSELQSHCGPPTCVCPPRWGHLLVIGCFRRDIVETGCQEPACRHRRLMAGCDRPSRRAADVGLASAPVGGGRA